MIKYIGSKRVLVPHIVRGVSAFPKSERVLDLFSGTSRVARGLKESGRYVIANDHLSYAATLAPAPPPAGSHTIPLARSNQYGGLHVGARDVSAAGITVDPANRNTWSIRVTRPGGGDLADDTEVEDLFVILGYQWQ